MAYIGNNRVIAMSFQEGKSAYEVAVLNGFEGSEEEWLASLKGEKGDAGVIKFIIVNELPTENIENAIYLIPSTDAESENAFDEYIYTSGAWEKIGSAGVKVNLDEYVKNTDYATEKKGGVVMVDIRYGTRLVNGILDICAANKNVIDSRTTMENPLYGAGSNSRHTITPANIDYAVKKVLIDKKVELTEEEQAAAQEWLGLGSIGEALDTIIAIQEELMPKPTLITFTISGIEYTAIEGMTWQEWCDSEYNTEGFWVFDNSIQCGLTIVFDSNNRQVSPNEVIDAAIIYHRS